MENKNKKKKLLFLFIFLIIIILLVILFIKFNPFKKDVTETNITKVSVTSVMVYVDDTITINSPSTDKKVKWVSSDPEIATVSNGIVKGHKSGVVTVFVYVDDKIVNKYEVTVFERLLENESKAVEVESISIDKTNITLLVDETKTIVATIIPENAEDKSITWSSSDENIASVVDGQITGRKVGTAIITVTAQNGVTVTAKVNVIANDTEMIDVSSISLKAEKTNIDVGNTIKVKTTISPDNATDKTIEWSSSDDNIATVSGGEVTGINPGNAIITAKSSNGKESSVTITVKAIQASSVSLNKKDITIKVGETITLGATVLPNNTTDKSVVWSSSDDGIVSVKDGQVTGKKAGNATITVTTKNGKTDKCVISVQAVPVTGISLNSAAKMINVGESFPLSATITPSDATNKEIVWSSSDSSVATVSDKGLVKGVKDGTATITATTDNGKNATFVATIKTPVSSVSLDRSIVYMLPENPKEDEGTYKRALVATVSPSNATNKEVTWSSSNPAVATVDSNGIVYAKKAGTTTITVKTKDGNKTAKASVSVESDELTNIYEVSPSLVCALTRDTSNDIRAMQGVYFYKSGSTVYSLYAGYQADDKPTVMTLVNLNTCSIIAKNNEQVFGHANDIGYLDGKFYVVNSNKVHGVTVNNNSTITLDANPTKMNYSFSGFEYDPVNKKFYSKVGNYIYTFPKLTSPKSSRTWIGIVPNYYSNIEGGNIKIINQGLAYANGNIYIPRTISDSSSTHYNHSYILVYDAKTAKYKYTMHFSGNFLCHLEGMTVIGDSMYLGMNCHQASPKNQTFLVYNGLAAIEQRYQNS